MLTSCAAILPWLVRMVVGCKSVLQGRIAFPAKRKHANIVRSFLCYLEEVPRSVFQGHPDTDAKNPFIGFFRMHDPVVADAALRFLTFERQYAASLF